MMFYKRVWVLIYDKMYNMKINLFCNYILLSLNLLIKRCSESVFFVYQQSLHGIYKPNYTVLYVCLYVCVCDVASPSLLIECLIRSRSTAIR